MEITAREPGSRYDYIHREDNGVDLYFLSSQNRGASRITAAFRVTGRQPELWNHVTDETRPASSFYQKDGKTYIPQEFDPYGSVFVVFRDEIAKDKSGSAPSNFMQLQTAATLHGSWDVAFDPAWDGPVSTVFNEIASWTDRNEEGIKYYSGKAVYKKNFVASQELTGSKQVFLDLGEVKDIGIARVTLNGKDLGILWAPPLRVTVNGLLKERNNLLQVEVVNTWRNRLIGDRTKPVEKRFTQTNVKVLETWQLTPSGLLGPVRLLNAPKH